MTNNELVFRLNKIVAKFGNISGSSIPIYEIIFGKWNGKHYLWLYRYPDYNKGTDIGCWDEEPSPTEVLNAFTNWLNDRKQTILTAENEAMEIKKEVTK